MTLCHETVSPGPEKLILNEKKFKKLSPVGLLLGPGICHLTGMFHKQNTMVNLFVIFAMVEPPIFNEVFTQAKQRRMSNVLSSSFMVFYSTPKTVQKRLLAQPSTFVVSRICVLVNANSDCITKQNKKKVKSICDLNSKCSSFYRPPFKKG